MHKRLFSIVASLAIVAAACGGATPSSAPPASSGPSTAPSTAPASAAAGEQTLKYAIDADISGGLTNAADNVPAANANIFLYDALYKFDASLTPQPALASKLADISPDGKVWTVSLTKGVKFHDGTALTDRKSVV